MATKIIQTSTHIQASSETVWSILTDFERYPKWNSFIAQISGRPEIGQTLKASIGGMSFQPTVLVATPNQELRWKGKLLINGVFDGEHSFVIEPKADGVLFHQNETFTGLLVGLFAKKLDTETKAGFEAMNLVLKKRAEEMEADAVKN
ncbi:MAG: SRPBCC domain-containing protein [Bacteroidota bacterium]